MTESDIKARICRMLREKAAELSEAYLVLRHEDSVITGLPDISVSARGKTTWWEVKYGRPTYQTTEAQKLMCAKLATCSYCRYILFRETADGRNKLTAICNPTHIIEFHTVSGFNYDWVVEQIRRVHEK